MARQDESDENANDHKSSHIPPINSEEAAVGFMKRPTAPSTQSASDNYTTSAHPGIQIAAASDATAEHKPTNQPDRSEHQAGNDQPDVFEAAKLMRDAVVRLALHRPAAAWNSIANWCRQRWSDSMHPWLNKIAPAVYTAVIVLTVAFWVKVKVFPAGNTLEIPNSPDSHVESEALETFQNELSLFPLAQEVLFCEADIQQCFLALNVLNEEEVLEPPSDAWWKFWEEETEAPESHDAGRNATINALLYTMKSVQDAQKVLEITGQNLNTTSERFQYYGPQVRKRSYGQIQELGLEEAYLESLTLSKASKIPDLDRGTKDLKLHLRFSDWVTQRFTGSRHVEVEAAEQAAKAAACDGIRNTLGYAYDGMDYFVSAMRTADRQIDDLIKAFNEGIRGLALTRSALTTAPEWSTKIDPRTAEDMQTTIKLGTEKLAKAGKHAMEIQKKLRLKAQTMECREVEVRGPHAIYRDTGHGKAPNHCVNKLEERMPQYVQMLGTLHKASIAWGC